MVVSEPSKDPDRVVIGNRTTWRADKDQACLLQGGDHPAVQHPTCANYRDAKVVPLRSLLELKLGPVAILEDQGLVHI
jgi:hypothetical protein